VARLRIPKPNSTQFTVTTTETGTGQDVPRRPPTAPRAAWWACITYITTKNSNTTPNGRGFRQADHIDQQHALVSWPTKTLFSNPLNQHAKHTTIRRRIERTAAEMG
jgi:hypothetical protein